MRTAKKRFQHLAIVFDAEGEWIVADHFLLARTIAMVEIEVSRAGKIVALVGDPFTLAEEPHDFARKPAILLQHPALGDDDVVGRDDAGFFVEGFDDRETAVANIFLSRGLPCSGVPP